MDKPRRNEERENQNGLFHNPGSWFSFLRRVDRSLLFRFGQVIRAGREEGITMDYDGPTKQEDRFRQIDDILSP